MAKTPATKAKTFTPVESVTLPPTSSPRRQHNKDTQLVAYDVFHSIDSYFSTSLEYGRDKINKKDMRRAFRQGKYQYMHTFELPAEPVADQLEKIFEYSQNLDDAWRPNSPCRSTSVGDIVRTRNTYWVVAPIGFDRLWKE